MAGRDVCCVGGPGWELMTRRDLSAYRGVGSGVKDVRKGGGWRERFVADALLKRPDTAIEGWGYKGEL